MNTKDNRIVYNITLQSEDDEMMKVIDRLTLEIHTSAYFEKNILECFFKIFLFSSNLSSSSMQEHKRRFCCGLSSCCSKSDDILMIDNAKLTCAQKLSICCCLPFRSCCKPCRRKKITQMTSEPKDNTKPSIWRKLCCCSSCCKKQDKVRFICSYAKFQIVLN